MLGGDAIRTTLEVTTAYEEIEAARSAPSGGQRDAVLSAYNATTSSYDEIWPSNFRNFRWPKGGWTLQELLAPKVVERFDTSRIISSGKASFERHICDTNIQVLRCSLLSAFSIDERFSW